MAAKGAFPHLLGGFYALDAAVETFIPGVDGEPEFPSLDQKWRVVEPIDQSDVDSVIEEGGNIEPVVVRKRKDGRAEIVDGRQRARWIRAANVFLEGQGLPPLKLKALLQDKNMTEAVAHRKMLASNYHRVEPSAMQKSDDAWGRCVLLGETDATTVSKATLQAVASLMRTSVSTVRNYIALQRLSDKAKRAAANRELGINVLLPLADLSEDEQDARLDDFFAKKAGGATSADLVEAARTARDESTTGSGVTAPESRKQGAGSGSADNGNGNGTGNGGSADGAGQAPKGLRMAQVKALLRLAKADREAGHGAGMSLSDDVVKFLEIVVGAKPPARLKGVTELLHRAAKGE